METTKNKKAVTEKTATATKKATTKKTDAEKTVTSTKKTTTAKATAKKIDAEKQVASAKKTTTTKASAKKTDEKVKSAVKKVDNSKHVLFIASEAWPFAGTGGLGEVIGSLPKELNKMKGIEARVIIPLYENLPNEYRKKLKFVCSLEVPVAWRMQYCGLLELKHEGVTFYFVDNEYYFKRSNIYGYGDDGERFAFFSRAVLELLPKMDWRVDVLHCNDWHTALVPVYYKLYYQYYQNLGGIKTVFTIHNIEYQGFFNGNLLEDVFGISYREYVSLEWGGGINLMKSAIDYSDSVTTVSNTYAGEIMRAEYAHGLESILLKNAYKLKGILNGIDTDVYNPSTNPSLFRPYDASNVDTEKARNKTRLQKMLGLHEDKNVPVVAMISRLVSHKGVDLVRSVFRDIMNEGAQFIILGTGDADHESFFRQMEEEYGEKVRAVIAFNKDMAQKIYAGADIFLMPSKSEPCGLSQMMAMRYGTIPVVRATGGLKDSVTDCGNGDGGTGFVFENYNADELRHAMARAIGLYRDYFDKWVGLRKRAMASDFSWKRSAKEYLEFYNEL